MIGALLSRSLRPLGVAVFCLVSSVPSLWADPVTVTSGLFVVAWDDPTSFLFLGADGFFLRAYSPMTISPQQRCIRGCAPGTVLDMSAVAGSALGTSTGAIINGTVFANPDFPPERGLRLAGTFRFDAPAITLPPNDGALGVTFAAPFIFNGDVTGFAADDLDSRMPLFHVALVGQGTVELLVDGDGFNGTYRDPEVSYTFAATPEPTTLALLATGFAGLVARARTNRRRVFRS
jgi:hypothetical protein